MTKDGYLLYFSMDSFGMLYAVMVSNQKFGIQSNHKTNKIISNPTTGELSNNGCKQPTEKLGQDDYPLLMIIYNVFFHCKPKIQFLKKMQVIMSEISVGRSLSYNRSKNFLFKLNYLDKYTLT